MLKKVIMLLLMLMIPTQVFSYEKEIQSISSKLLEKINSKSLKSVAVVQLTKNDGGSTELGYFLAETISSEIVSQNKGELQIVDRLSINTLLEEHKISASGLLNPENTKKLGKMANVDALVVGTMTLIGEEAHLVVKIINVETATVLSSVMGSILLSESLKELYFKNNEIKIISSESSDENTIKIPSLKATEKGGIKINITKCKFINNEDGAVCSFIITSKNKTRKVYLGVSDSRLKSTLLNQSGNSAVAANACFNSYCHVVGSGSRYIKQTIDANTPVSTQIWFPISDLTTSIKLVNIVFETGEKQYNVAFSNIPLDR